MSAIQNPSVLGASTAPGIQLALSQSRILMVANNVNFNSANTDTSFPVTLPTGYSNYTIAAIRISNASASLTSATCGVFSGAGGTGTQLVATGTAITVSTSAANTANNMQQLTVINNGATQSSNYATIFFRVQTAEGAPATASVMIELLVCS